ncbi:MAG: AbrB/MazE/SpoVT family DNA-binding domain-containing protein [Cellvibrionales bacterium]|nr:AbrB/MazE/SpoVT family DNA-binding domain-containing protein [Cellvibrionales bacterium]
MQTRVFKSGNSQAVRIPKELGFPDGLQDVEIERRGDELIIRPLRQHRLTSLRSKLAAFSVDFMTAGRPAAEPETERAGW